MTGASLYAAFMDLLDLSVNEASLKKSHGIGGLKQVEGTAIDFMEYWFPNQAKQASNPAPPGGTATKPIWGSEYGWKAPVRSLRLIDRIDEAKAVKSNKRAFSAQSHYSRFVDGANRSLNPPKRAREDIVPELEMLGLKNKEDVVDVDLMFPDTEKLVGEVEWTPRRPTTCPKSAVGLPGASTVPLVQTARRS